MCTTTHFRSRRCGHHWLQITTPCFPGLGFNHCYKFRDGVARSPAPFVSIDVVCPACWVPDAYDKNRIRMVEDIRDTWRWGLGPSRGDPGLDCQVM